MSATDRNAAAPRVSSDLNASSVRTTISRQKRAANRRNARRSTGPRTEVGKRVSSYNAVTHGIFCAELLLPGEDGGELLELRERVHASLGIDGDDVVEIGYADTVVAARWKLRRVNAAERDLHVAAVARMRRTVGRQLAGHDARTAARCEAGFWDQAEEDRVLADAADRRARLEMLRDGPDPMPCVTLATDFAGDGAWERLSRYEQRLEQNIARAMRELRAHRKELREHGRAEVLVEETDPIERIARARSRARRRREAQNEPTAEETAACDAAAGGCERVPGSMGVGPMQNDVKQDMGGTPMLREEEQTRENPARESSD